MGLFQNIRTAMAVQSAIYARGIAACFSADANADLLKDCGGSAKEIAAMKIEAMKQKSGFGR